MPWKGVGLNPIEQARRVSPGLEQEPDSEMVAVDLRQGGQLGDWYNSPCNLLRP